MSSHIATSRRNPAGILSVLAVAFAVFPVVYAFACLLLFAVVFRCIGLFATSSITSRRWTFAAVLFVLVALLWFPIILFVGELLAAVCGVAAFHSTAPKEPRAGTVTAAQTSTRPTLPTGSAPLLARMAPRRWPFALLAATLSGAFIATCAFLLSLMARDIAFRSALARLFHLHT